MGVQFVQIGDEEEAKEALKMLVMGDNGVRCAVHSAALDVSDLKLLIQSIVDTVPYRGVLTPERLQRILLGGIHPNVRATLPVELLAN